jgi:transcriptional regulator with XRE-family HTH domain/tetratricopeptide (TPR) repeat protein
LLLWISFQPDFAAAGLAGERQRTLSASAKFELGVSRRRRVRAANGGEHLACRCTAGSDRAAGMAAGNHMRRSRRGGADLPPGPARDLVDLLRRLRQDSGLSLGQIAARAELSRSHISEVLRGWKTPSPRAAASIARVLGASERQTAKAHQWAAQALELKSYYRTHGVPPSADHPLQARPSPDLGTLGNPASLSPATASGWDGGLGQLVRSHRLAAGTTQEELAERSRLSVHAISDIECGRTVRPHPRSARMLADALKLTASAREQFLAVVDATDGLTREADREPDVPQRVVPRQLPATVHRFVGRNRELAALARSADPADGPPVMVISGIAGVGKTALAVHFAHQVADAFPDGQLYVDLLGFSTSGDPLTPQTAVRGFLDALNIALEQIPADPSAQQALYRSVLADRRMLVVLDNARDEQQVRPLLPGGGNCLVLVTSRAQLVGLAATDSASMLSLGVLCDSESRQLLAERLGAARVRAEPEAVAELIALCGGLPLALAITAARAASSPVFPLAALAAEMRTASRRLDTLDTGDAAASVRAVFSGSYASLSSPAAQAFRLLSLHPGPDVSLPAAASLFGLPVLRSRALLGELRRACLVTEQAPGRFSLHDLLRAYATEQAMALDTEKGRHAATGRVLDHYLHTACACGRLLEPHNDKITLPPPRAGTQPEHPSSYRQAMGWFAAEHRVLLAVVAQAGGDDWDGHAWQLAWAFGGFLDRCGHWHDLVRMQRPALAAAERLGDRTGQAHVRRITGHALFWLGARDEARTHLSVALDLYRELRHYVGQARIHIDLALIHEHLGRCADALDHGRRGLELSRAARHRALQARALNCVGWYLALLDDHDAALENCAQALELSRDCDDQYVEACSLDSLGYIHHQLGRPADAITYYQRALSLRRKLGGRVTQAETLIRLGDTWSSLGDVTAASGAWREALAILDETQHPQAGQVRVKLRTRAASLSRWSRCRAPKRSISGWPVGFQNSATSSELGF